MAQYKIFRRVPNAGSLEFYLTNPFNPTFQCERDIFNMRVLNILSFKYLPPQFQIVSFLGFVTSQIYLVLTKFIYKQIHKYLQHQTIFTRYTI